MDKKLKADWLMALRSGQFRQGRKILHSGNSYCCLGVLQEIGGIDSDSICFLRRGAFNNSSVPGLSMETQRELSHMNDDGESFVKIADYIEAHPNI